MAETVNVRLAGMEPRPFRHRGTPSDVGAISQVFAQEDYSLAPLRRSHELLAAYDGMLRSSRRPLILDAGANIGAASVYFALRYPQAHILAVEPDQANFELLERNAAGLDVDARRAGIAARAGSAALVDPGEGEWGYRTAPGAPGTVQVPLLACSELVASKMRERCAPFIAKIDIEGAEGELFSESLDWIDLFPLLIVELHDWLLPGQGTSRNFLRCMAARDRDFVYIGENVFSIRNG